MNKTHAYNAASDHARLQAEYNVALGNKQYGKCRRIGAEMADLEARVERLGFCAYYLFVWGRYEAPLVGPKLPAGMWH